MSKKKKISVNQPINNADTTITAGDIIGMFEGMDPNTPIAEGSLTISSLNSTNNEDADMNVDYACNCDTCTCDCDDNQKYGDRTPKVMNLANMYNSGDFVQDTTDMDTDFAAFMAHLQIATSDVINDEIDNMKQRIEEHIVNASKLMMDNLTSYQNTKNARTEMELEIVAKRIK